MAACLTSGFHRPRLFESNVLVLAPDAPRVECPIGVYGTHPDGRTLWVGKDWTSRAASSEAEAGDAMGIDWMDWAGLREAIPPAYTELIGRALRKALEERDAEDRVLHGHTG